MDREVHLVPRCSGGDGEGVRRKKMMMPYSGVAFCLIYYKHIVYSYNSLSKWTVDWIGIVSKLR